MTIERSFAVDLQKPMTPRRLTDVLTAGDCNAHRFLVKLTHGQQPVGGIADVTACFLRADGVTVLLQGEKHAGGEVSITLSEACYRAPGWSRLSIRAADADGAAATVLILDMMVSRSRSNAVTDPDELIPTLDALMAKLGEMQYWTEAARNAAVRADAAAQSVPAVSRDSRGDVVITAGT